MFSLLSYIWSDLSLLLARDAVTRVCLLSSSGAVNESRQVLQEPDFAQSLLRDPNTPIIRKSRGTSTQGTSTHASSTHLAMLDDVRSKASSVHSYHGSLHRSRDGGSVQQQLNTIYSHVHHIANVLDLNIVVLYYYQALYVKYICPVFSTNMKYAYRGTYVEKTTVYSKT